MELGYDEYLDEDFEDAVALIRVQRLLDGRNRPRRALIITVLRKHAACIEPNKKIGGVEPHFLLDLINKRKELRDATNNTLKQSNAGQADSTPSKLNAPRCNG